MVVPVPLCHRLEGHARESSDGIDVESVGVLFAEPLLIVTVGCGGKKVLKVVEMMYLLAKGLPVIVGQLSRL